MSIGMQSIAIVATSKQLINKKKYGKIAKLYQALIFAVINVYVHVTYDEKAKEIKKLEDYAEERRKTQNEDSESG